MRLMGWCDLSKGTQLRAGTAGIAQACDRLFVIVPLPPRGGGWGGAGPAAAWAQHSGCSEVDGVPFTPCMGSTLGQEPAGVCCMPSQVLLFKVTAKTKGRAPGVFYQVRKEREGRKRAKGCACELPDLVKSPRAGLPPFPSCTGASDPVISVVRPSGTAAWLGQSVG